MCRVLEWSNTLMVFFLSEYHHVIRPNTLVCLSVETEGGLIRILTFLLDHIINFFTLNVF